MYELHHGDCLDILPTLPAQSVDAVIADPPYPEIDRPYGRMTEAVWAEMMHAVVTETRRVLKPHGSAVFILQPNSRKVGSMRPWLWEFMAWCCREWNIVQDAYWWNPVVAPSGHASHFGLMRGSVKPVIWLGAADCYRNQDSVLWSEAEASKARYACARAGRHTGPSGHSGDLSKGGRAAQRRGGVTPFNMLPFANTDSANSAGAHGHGAGTPAKLINWWLRYITKPGDTVLDMFTGSGTTGIEAAKIGRAFIGMEKYPLLDRPIDAKRNPDYFRIASERIAAAYAPLAAMEAAS